MKQQDLFGAGARAEDPKPRSESTAKSVDAPARPVPPLPPRPEVKQPAWREPRQSVRQQPTVLSVSELTWQLKDLIEPTFARVLVRGEVTGFRGPNTRGHLYFSLKDANAVVEVRLWQTTARALKFQLRDGLAVIIEGSLNLYEPQGRYSLIVQKIEPEGVGARALAFEQLKQKLAAEGLIGERRTKPRRSLPFLPKRIGVVTSVSGAALRDFLKVLHRRHPRLSVLVADARVQGDGAAFEVRRAIRALNRTDVDVIVVTRGGGSVDDLWTFNEEAVVRAIFESRVPVVSAVGHEIDTTLADLVADHRAPTPSAAAEALSPVEAELSLQLGSLRAQLIRGIEKALLARRNELKALRNAVGDPRRRLIERRLLMSDAAERLSRHARRRLRQKQNEFNELSKRLQQARPQAQLAARRERWERFKARLTEARGRLLAEPRAGLSRLTLRLERASPRPRLQQQLARLDQLERRLVQAMRARVLAQRHRTHQLASTLEALSPLKVLARGYAIVQRPDGRVVRRSLDARPGDSLSIRLGHGEHIEVVVVPLTEAQK